MDALLSKAKAGDIIFIQEEVLFDHYTKLNTQISHVIKQLLRLKVDYQKSQSDYDDPELIDKWCRCGIICNSKLKDVKYLLEITKDGIEEYELSTRLFMLKNQGNIIGFKALAKNLFLDRDQLHHYD